MFEIKTSLQSMSLTELKRELRRALRAYNQATDRANKSGLAYHAAMKATESGTPEARAKFKQVRDYSTACFEEKARLDEYTAKLESKIEQLKAKGKQQNPRYLITGDGRELAILAEHNKMQAVRRAKRLYPGLKKYEATLTDKQTYLGRAPKKVEYGAQMSSRKAGKKRKNRTINQADRGLCFYCGKNVGQFSGPEHDPACPRYEKPKKAGRKTIGRRRKNRTIIKAGNIEHVDVSRIHNGQRQRNVLQKDAEHPIEVVKHFRQGPPGYLSPWQRAAAMGQDELFSTGITLSKRAAAMRGHRNPGASAGVYKSGLKEATASQLGRLARVGLRTGKTPAAVASDLRATGRFKNAQIKTAVSKARLAEKKRTANNPQKASATKEQIWEAAWNAYILALKQFEARPKKGPKQRMARARLVKAMNRIHQLDPVIYERIVLPEYQKMNPSSHAAMAAGRAGNRRKQNPIPKEKFTDAQLTKLRAEYATIKTVDPDGPVYTRLKAYLREIESQENGRQLLEQLAHAKIKWLSYEAAKQLGYSITDAFKISKGIKNPRQKRTGRTSAKLREAFKEFSGKEARGAVTLMAPKGTPAQVAKLGQLRKIRVKDGRTWTFTGQKAPYLARDVRGKLHVVGGKYRANPQDMNVGEIVQIEYETAKPHLGQHAPMIYFHDLGEENGIRPTMLIDGEGLIRIEGGDYRIETDGIHN